MIKRGDLYWAYEKGAQTIKPRPVLVLQTDRANPHHTTITVCLLTSATGQEAAFRIAVEPTVVNGLEKPSIIQADRLYSYQVTSFSHRLGTLEQALLGRVEAAVRLWLEL